MKIYGNLHTQKKLIAVRDPLNEYSKHSIIQKRILQQRQQRDQLQDSFSVQENTLQKVSDFRLQTLGNQLKQDPNFSILKPNIKLNQSFKNQNPFVSDVFSKYSQQPSNQDYSDQKNKDYDKINQIKQTISSPSHRGIERIEKQLKDHSNMQFIGVSDDFHQLAKMFKNSARNLDKKSIQYQSSESRPEKKHKMILDQIYQQQKEHEILKNLQTPNKPTLFKRVGSIQQLDVASISESQTDQKQQKSVLKNMQNMLSQGYDSTKILTNVQSTQITQINSRMLSPEITLDILELNNNLNDDYIQLHEIEKPYKEEHTFDTSNLIMKKENQYQRYQSVPYSNQYLSPSKSLINSYNQEKEAVQKFDRDNLFKIKQYGVSLRKNLKQMTKVISYNDAQQSRSLAHVLSIKNSPINQTELELQKIESMRNQIFNNQIKSPSSLVRKQVPQLKQSLFQMSPEQPPDNNYATIKQSSIQRQDQRIDTESSEQDNKGFTVQRFLSDDKQKTEEILLLFEKKLQQPSFKKLVLKQIKVINSNQDKLKSSKSGYELGIEYVDKKMLLSIFSSLEKNKFNSGDQSVDTSQHSLAGGLKSLVEIETSQGSSDEHEFARAGDSQEREKQMLIQEMTKSDEQAFKIIKKVEKRLRKKQKYDEQKKPKPIDQELQKFIENEDKINQENEDKKNQEKQGNEENGGGWRKLAKTFDNRIITPFQNKITPPQGFVKVISDKPEQEKKSHDDINAINEVLEKADIEMLEDDDFYNHVNKLIRNEESNRKSTMKSSSKTTQYAYGSFLDQVLGRQSSMSKKKKSFIKQIKRKNKSITKKQINSDSSSETSSINQDYINLQRTQEISIEQDSVSKSEDKKPKQSILMMSENKRRQMQIKSGQESEMETYDQARQRENFHKYFSVLWEDQETKSKKFEELNQEIFQRTEETELAKLKQHNFLQQLNKVDNYTVDAIKRCMIEQMKNIELKNKNEFTDTKLAKMIVKDPVINGLCLLYQFKTNEINLNKIHELEQEHFQIPISAKNIIKAANVLFSKQIKEYPGIKQQIKANQENSFDSRNVSALSNNSRSTPKPNGAQSPLLEEDDRYEIFNTKIFTKVVEQIFKHQPNLGFKRQKNQNFDKINIYEHFSLKDFVDKKDQLIDKIISLNDSIDIYNKKQKKQIQNEIEFFTAELKMVEKSIKSKQELLGIQQKNVMAEFAEKIQGEQTIFQLARKINYSNLFYKLFKHKDMPKIKSEMDQNTVMNYILASQKSSGLSLPIFNRIISKTLILKDYQLTNPSCIALANAFSSDKKCVSSIYMINNFCKDQDFATILQGAKQLDYIKTIVYKNNEFFTSSLNALVPFLSIKKPFHLQELRIISCKIGATVTHDLINALLDCNQLKKLSLIKANMSRASFSQVCRLVRTSRNLLELDLSYNDFRPKQMFELFSIISLHDRKFQSINLSWNCIQDSEISIIPSIIKEQTDKDKKKAKIACERTFGQMSDLLLDYLFPDRVPEDEIKIFLREQIQQQIEEMGEQEIQEMQQTFQVVVEDQAEVQNQEVQEVPTQEGQEVPAQEVPPEQQPAANPEEAQPEPPKIKFLPSIADKLFAKRQKALRLAYKILTRNMSAFLKYNQKLIHLDLSFTGINEELCKQIGTCLSKSRALCSVHLTGNPGLTEKFSNFLKKRIKIKQYEPRIEINFLEAFKTEKQKNNDLTIEQKRDTINENLKLQNLKRDIQAKESHLKIEADFDRKKFNLIRYLGHQCDMPGSGQWQLQCDNLNPLHECWICGQWVHSLIFWSQTIGDYQSQLQQVKQRKSKKAIINDLLNAYPELEMINDDTKNVEKKQTQKIDTETDQQNEAAIDMNETMKEDGDEEVEMNAGETEYENFEEVKQKNQKVEKRLKNQYVFLDSDENRPLVCCEFTNWKPVRMLRMDEYCLSLDSKVSRKGIDLFELAVQQNKLHLEVLQHKDYNKLRPHEQESFNEFKKKYMHHYDILWHDVISDEIRYKKPFLANGDQLSSARKKHSQGEEPLYVFPCFMRPGKQNYIIVSDYGLAKQSTSSFAANKKMPTDIDSYYIHKCIAINRQEDVPLYTKPMRIAKKEREFKLENSPFRDWRLDKQDTLDKCLEHDFDNWKIARFCKDAGEAEKCKDVLRIYFNDIKEIYHYQISKSNFPSIGWLDLTSWTNSIKILDDNVDQSAVDRSFTAANVTIQKEGEKEKISSLANPENSLIRYEFLEIIVRLAKIKYLDPGKCQFLSDAIHMLVKQNIYAFDCSEEWTQWRNREFWTLQISDLFEANVPALKKLYDSYFEPRKNNMDMQDCINLFYKQTSILKQEKHVIQCYGMSKMTVTLETKDSKKYQILQFVEFLEVIGRVAQFKFGQEGGDSSMELVNKVEFLLDEILATMGIQRLDPVIIQVDESESDIEY